MRPPARFWTGLVLHSSQNAARRDGFPHERERAFTFVIFLATKGGDDYYCVANPGRTQVFRSAFDCHEGVDSTPTVGPLILPIGHRVPSFARGGLQAQPQ